MASSWLAFLPSYPELILAVTCFSLIFILSQIKTKKLIVNWPILGMFPAILSNINNLHDYITAVLGKSRGYTFQFWGPWFLGMDFLLTCDPANVNHVFNTNFANYPKGGEFAEIFDILGVGIFNADGESWRSQRKKGHSLVSHPKFRSFVATCSRNKVEKGLVPLLTRLADQEEGVVDLQDVFLRLTFDMTCNLVFGVDPGGLSVGFPTIPFARAMDDAMEAIFVRHTVPPSFWKAMRWLRIGKERKLSAARGVMDDFAARSIAKSREEGNRGRGSLLSSYVDSDSAEDESSSLSDDKFLRDTAVNFMLAGRDTTGAALAWFFWLLSKNPKVEEKIIEELIEKKQQSSEDCDISPILFGADELSKLVYLHAALCETLRLYPPVPFEHKSPVRSDVLPSGTKAPSGRKIMFSTYSMGRMEGVWGKDCLEFRPERWISEEGRRLRHEPSFKFFSFNCGPRICLGKDIAFTQMKVIVAAVICNFRVEGVEGHSVEPKPSVILQMKNGWRVKMKKRDLSKMLHGN